MNFAHSLVCSATALAIASFATNSLAAGDGPRLVPTAVTTPAPQAANQAPACQEKSVIVLLDVTGSFVDHLLTKDLFTNSIKRIRADFPRLCIGSEVKIAIIGHSHRNVTGTYDHLASTNYIITRNHVNADNIAAMVIKQLEKWRDDLASGKLKQQENTAVGMAFDNVAEVVQLKGKPAVIWAITDGDETELGGVPAPYKPGQLAGATVYMFGAGVTLTAGTEGQRKLRKDWERYFGQAGAEKFFWVSKP